MRKVKEMRKLLITGLLLAALPILSGPVFAEDGDAIENRPMRGCEIAMPEGPQIEGTFLFDPWPSGIVPYEFNANVAAWERSAMLVAMADWEAVANIDFRPRSGESDYVHIQDSTVNSSPVGQGSGKRTIKIYNWNFEFIMAHELSHTLGFWHEQSRPDRDTYVTINLGNIKDDMEYNFDKKAGAYTYGTYDFDSVMHYGQCAFTTCGTCNASTPGCWAITMKPGYTQHQSTIGQRTHLSDLDVLGMQMVYPQSNWRFVDGTYTGFFEFGTFLLPWDTFQEGAANVPWGGTVVIQPDVYNSAEGTYTRAMTLWAPLSGVTLR